MDSDDIRLITELQEKMEQRIVETINGTATGIRATIKGEVNRIDEMDKQRNNRISKLENQTVVIRWAHRNPKVAIIVFAMFMLTVAFGYHTINFKRTAERLLKIELNEGH